MILILEGFGSKSRGADLGGFNEYNAVGTWFWCFGDICMCLKTYPVHLEALPGIYAARTANKAIHANFSTKIKAKWPRGLMCRGDPNMDEEWVHKQGVFGMRCIWGIHVFWEGGLQGPQIPQKYHSWVLREVKKAKKPDIVKKGCFQGGVFWRHLTLGFRCKAALGTPKKGVFWGVKRGVFWGFWKGVIW